MPIDLRPKEPEEEEEKCVPDPESLELENLVDDTVDGAMYAAAGCLMFLLFAVLSPWTDWDPDHVTLFRIAAIVFMSVGYLLLRRIRL